MSARKFNKNQNDDNIGVDFAKYLSRSSPREHAAVPVFRIPRRIRAEVHFMRSRLFVLAFAVWLTPLSGHAIEIGQLPNNLAPNGDLIVSPIATIYRQPAEDFRVQQDFSLTNVRFWTLEDQSSGTNPWDGTLNFTLWGGDPLSPTPMGMLTSQTPLVWSKTATGLTPNPYTQYLYSFDLTAPFKLTAGNLYWIQLFLGNFTPGALIVWQDSLAPDIGLWPAVYGTGGPPSTAWPTTNLTSKSFVLQGVPVPASLWLLAAGLLGLGAARRRR